jgi:GT2 family glycosyltransferase
MSPVMMMDDSDQPGGSRVTVVMITRDRGVEARRSVDRLLSLPERPPVIVVDNASTDRTVQVLASYSERITVIPLGHNAGAAGRNVGVAAATTPYVAFADDDSAWAPGALTRGVEILDAHPRLAVVAARVLLGERQLLDPACAVMAASRLPGDPALPGRPVLGFVACAALVRRDAFIAVGGFDERYGVGGEEGPLAIELAARGWALTYVDDVTAQHWPSPLRDPVSRRRIVVRNALWLSWSRRRWPTVLRATARSVRAAVNDDAARAGLIDATRGIAEVLRARRCVDRWLERHLQLID